MGALQKGAIRQENHRVPHMAHHHQDEDRHHQDKGLHRQGGDHLEDLGTMDIEDGVVATGQEGVAGVSPGRFRCSNFI